MDSVDEIRKEVMKLQGLKDDRVGASLGAIKVQLARIMLVGKEG